MRAALLLLLTQGVLGAWDTLYYHELRCKLPQHAEVTAPELRLHAARDFIYALVFCTLPLYRWQGFLAWVLAALLSAEIAITLADFVVEDRVRKLWGGVAPGERVMHALMAIIYGAFLACFLPELYKWSTLETGFFSQTEFGTLVTFVGLAMGAGVALSGARDLWAYLRRGRKR